MHFSEPYKTDYLFYQTRSELPFIDRAEGVYLYDHTGKKYLDGCSGAINTNIGHGNPRILQAIAEQARKVFFSYRTQFENEPAHRLAAKLVHGSAEHLTKVFYVSSGSEAIESAMKLARQYYFNRGQKSRYQFISRTPSYHGSTLGALSLTSSAQLELPFRPMLKSYPKIPSPYCFRCPYNKRYPSCNLACAWELETTILEQGPDSIIGFMVEPIGGASTGALVPPDDYFDVIQHICKKYDILLILDEVMTGMGRTGAMYAYEHWNIKADIIALSKGLTSGYFPVGAILTTDEIVDDMMEKGGFAHGHTLAGNPMGCAVALEVYNVIEDEGLVENSAKMGKLLIQGLNKLAKRYSIIGQVRGKGLLTAIEIVKPGTKKDIFPPEMDVNHLIADWAFKDGLILYPRRPINGLRGDHILIAPPLISDKAVIEELLELLDKTLARSMFMLG